MGLALLVVWFCTCYALCHFQRTITWSTTPACSSGDVPPGVKFPLKQAVALAKKMLSRLDVSCELSLDGILHRYVVPHVSVFSPPPVGLMASWPDCLRQDVREGLVAPQRLVVMTPTELMRKDKKEEMDKAVSERTEARMSVSLTL